MKIFKRLACAVLVVAAFFALAAGFAGCSVEEVYKKVYDGETFVGWELDYSGYKNKIEGNIVVPATHGEGEEQKPVVKIADQAFAGSSITSVTIPASVEKIGTAAFAYCDHLKSVTFEGTALKEIPQGAFGYCATLSDITLPQGIESIGYMSFYECSSLTSVNIPVGVTKIGASAFEGCSALAAATLPEGLVTIGYQAFYRCIAIKKVVIPSTVRDTVIEPEKEGDEPQTLYGIGYAAFHTCSALEDVEILGQIECIPSGAFGACTSLKRIFLPVSLKEVQGAYYSNGKVYYGHPFHNGYSPLTVYYEGTSNQWASIKINDGTASLNSVRYDNGTLLNAEMHYECTGLPTE